MAKKLNELIDLDKIQNAWNLYFELKNADQEEMISEGLNALERIILKALAEDFRDNI